METARGDHLIMKAKRREEKGSRQQGGVEEKERWAWSVFQRDGGG